MSMVFNKDPVRDFLESAAAARLEMHQCEYRSKAAFDECQRITAQLDQVPGGGSGDKHKDGAWAAFADLRTRLCEAYNRALQQEKKVEAFISALPDPVHRAVLYLRYLGVDDQQRQKPENRQRKPLLPWPRVQEELRKMDIWYEERHIHNIHGAALVAARELWAKQSREDTTA